jgi:hypothetical protein
MATLTTFRLPYGDSKVRDIAIQHKNKPEVRGAVVWYDIDGWKTHAGVITGTGELPKLDTTPLGNGAAPFFVMPMTEADRPAFVQAYGEELTACSLEHVLNKRRQ